MWSWIQDGPPVRAASCRKRTLVIARRRVRRPARRDHRPAPLARARTAEDRARTALASAEDERRRAKHERTESVTAARDDAERLVLAYPPSDIPGIDRGDGCCACPAYGNPCEGIEREWWSELEWEDARERLGSQ